jgi:hypothetical protein
LLRGFLRRNSRWLAQLSLPRHSAGAGAIMLLALFAWESDTQVKAPPDLPFTALAFVPDDGQIEPAAARDALRGAGPVSSFDTQLSEAPVWFAFTPPKLAPQRPACRWCISLRATRAACHAGAAALTPLGSASAPAPTAP